MRQRQWITALTPALLLLGIASFASAAPAAKIEVCHFPPGNPDNFHTITISENAFAAHLAHGDLGGACNALCATICDDGNACTIDDTADCEAVGCPTTSTPVDCNDQNGCTTDSCAPASGCVNTPSVGEACDDGAVCSGPDTCNAEGACEGAAIDNCCLGDEDCSQSPCDQASCNLESNRCAGDPVVCDPPDLCTVSECASDTGLCEGTAIVCPEGEACNPSTGVCAATGPILLDGGFELGLAAPGTCTQQQSYAYGAWTASQGGGPCFPAPVCGTPFPAAGWPQYEGSEMMHIGTCNYDSSVTQSFATVAGAQYELSMAVIGFSGASGLVEATVFNTSNVDLVANFASPAGAWGVSSQTFVATGTLTTLTIKHISGGGGIDDVRVTLLP